MGRAQTGYEAAEIREKGHVISENKNGEEDNLEISSGKGSLVGANDMEHKEIADKIDPATSSTISKKRPT